MYLPLFVLMVTFLIGWIGLLSGLIVPLAGYLVLFYKEVIKERYYTLRYTYHKWVNPKLIREMQVFRNEILSDLDGVTFSKDSD